jgi:hypothetical protein
VAGPPLSAWVWLQAPQIGRSGVAEATPWPLGVVQLPPMAQTKKKNNKKNHWPLRVAGPPPMAMGWLQPPQIGRFGAAEATPWPLGVVQPPSRPKLEKKKKKSLAVEGSRTTPNGHGVASTAPDRPGPN